MACGMHVGCGDNYYTADAYRVYFSSLSTFSSSF